MSLSYSYYNEADNPYSIDPNEELYNMALAVNNRNKMSNINKSYLNNSTPGFTNFPYFAAQGDYSEGGLNNVTENNIDANTQTDEYYENIGSQDSFSEMSNNTNISEDDKKYKKTNLKTQEYIPKYKKPERSVTQCEHLCKQKKYKNKDAKLEHIKRCQKCKKTFLDMIKKDKKYKKVKLNDHNLQIVKYTDEKNDSPISKETVMIILIGIAIILILDLLSNKR